MLSISQQRLNMCKHCDDLEVISQFFYNSSNYKFSCVIQVNIPLAFVNLFFIPSFSHLASLLHLGTLTFLLLLDLHHLLFSYDQLKLIVLSILALLSL